MSGKKKKRGSKGFLVEKDKNKNILEDKDMQAMAVISKDKNSSPGRKKKVPNPRDFPLRDFHGENTRKQDWNVKVSGTARKSKRRTSRQKVQKRGMGAEKNTGSIQADQQTGTLADMDMGRGTHFGENTLSQNAAGLNNKRKSSMYAKRTAQNSFRQNVQKPGRETEKLPIPEPDGFHNSFRGNGDTGQARQSRKKYDFLDKPFAYQDSVGQKHKQRKFRRKQQNRAWQEKADCESRLQNNDFQDTAEAASKDFQDNSGMGFTENAVQESAGQSSRLKPAHRKPKLEQEIQYSQKNGRSQNNRDKREDESRKHGKDTDFQSESTKINTEKEAGSFTGSRKLYRKQKQAEKAAQKLERASPPKKQHYVLQRVFDEKAGRGKHVLVPVEREDRFFGDGQANPIMRGIQAEARNFAHRKISEVEKENSAVEGVHKAEQRTEDLFSFLKMQYKGKAARQQKKLDRLEKRHFRKETNFLYQKFLEENPQVQKKLLRKRLQKQRIKKEYAKAKRGRAATKAACTATGQSFGFPLEARKLWQAAVGHKNIFAAVALLLLLFLIATSAMASCGAALSSIQSTVLASAYLSEPSEIDAADLELTRLELSLQEKIDSIESDYPGYDEYTYNLGEIGHNPFVLISYLSAVYSEFTASQIQGEIQMLFDEMYTLDIMPDTETGTRQVQAVDADGFLMYDGDGNPVMEDEEYDKSVLRVKLTVRSLESIVSGKMDAGQAELYEAYMESKGLLQQFGSPLGLNWYPYVGSYYGYRKNLSTGVGELHRGLDIIVPEGTQVYATHDGIVKEAAYDSDYGGYIIIEKDGYMTRYAHMGSFDVNVGQWVAKGDAIGTTGNTGSSTGSGLHMECLYDGEYYNPLFYFDTEAGGIYGENAGGATGNLAGGNAGEAGDMADGESGDLADGNGASQDSYGDAEVQALMQEAEKYFGMPYVWGGSSPSTSFDCSGFVCWVFTNSGVHNLPRTTAQGIYDQCIPVAPSEAKPGDIIFFTGTYHSPDPVSHVGIYCGNGIMAHAGDPIRQVSINTPYWQSHFYSFGRLYP